MSAVDALRALTSRAAAVLRKRSETHRDGTPARLPRHVAIVMDGNGRWAKRRNLPRSAGHAAGTEALRGIVRTAGEWGIEALSLYAFSTENWSRPDDEVQALMALSLKYFISEIDELNEKNVRILIMGDLGRLPDAQREAGEAAMARTRNNTGLKLNLAINYGGKAEIVNAARALMREALSGSIAPDQLTEDIFADHLYTRGQPDVDLFIRTSGEMRTSNFLPWQCAYAEMIFNPVLWPDYTADVFREDLWAYATRERRFGKVAAHGSNE